MQIDSAIELAKLINSEDLQRRLNDFAQLRADAEATIAKAKQDKADAEGAMQSADEQIKQRQADLAKSQAEHDAAATEAAKRIELSNSVKVELDRREASIKEREAKLGEREKAVETAHGQFMAALNQLGLMKP